MFKYISLIEIRFAVGAVHCIKKCVGVLSFSDDSCDSCFCDSCSCDYDSCLLPEPDYSRAHCPSE